MPGQGDDRGGDQRPEVEGAVHRRAPGGGGGRGRASVTAAHRARRCRWASRIRLSTEGSILRVKTGLATPMKRARTTQGHQDRRLARGQVGEASVLLVRDLAVEHALHHPEDVGGGQDHAEGGHRHHRLSNGQEPMRIRNSPTKPLKPGTAIEDRQTSRNSAENQGMTVLSPPNSAMSAGVAPVVEHAHHEEEGARRDAVVQHLVDGAHHRRRGEGGDAEHDEAEVGDRRIGHELLQVGLHEGDEGAVDDADHGQARRSRARSASAASGKSGMARRRKP